MLDTNYMGGVKEYDRLYHYYSQVFDPPFYMRGLSVPATASCPASVFCWRGMSPFPADFECGHGKALVSEHGWT